MVRPREIDRELVRSVSVLVRVRPSQRERWRMAARKGGESLSEWIRRELDRASRLAGR